MDLPVKYKKLYAVQDTILKLLTQLDTGFYLTGGTCLHRFYLHRRYSDDLDFFCNDIDLYRDYSREFISQLKEQDFNPQTLTDTRDFIRIICSGLKIDLVNDRVFRLGRTEKTPEGYKIDNIFNILTNKITAVIGRDEPKDVFDIYSISRHCPFSWSEMISHAMKKNLFQIDLLVDRLQSFPVSLLDTINAADKSFLEKTKKGITGIAEDILNGRDNII
ncbi:MAG: nucleotidyl transferase AbiEii/AbiGii toxin family protein [Spirochaetales bacterium]|nr:nucleotidyl transferase AbiEii/AbiGii toxin family protein [Spirochaetales bacterium]